MQDSIAKEKKWGKNLMEIRAIKGGEGVPTPNGKCHFKFPFFINPSLIEALFRDAFKDMKIK